jgi:uncharacterized protein (TIGR02757 family)
MELRRLKHSLDALYNAYDVRHLRTDPLQVVHDYSRPEDQEVVGLIAALFAYGRVPQILKTLGRIFKPMKGAPYDFVRGFDLKRDGPKFQGIVHRFNNEKDLLWLLLGLQQVMNRFGSLKALFLKGYSPSQADTGVALTRFVEHFFQLDYSLLYGNDPLPVQGGIRFLLPSPRHRSACKRLNMYLRWMVRRRDRLDLGLWEEVSPSQLLIPLDTHVGRIARRIGLTEWAAADWSAVLEITENLRRLDPEDPVKYDFALARLGILQRCSKEQRPDACRDCPLAWTCRR